MKFDHLQGFVSVATAGTFRKAARTLRVGQPALTRKIQALEHELGVELFRRSPTGVELTPAGRYLHTRANAILTELAQTKRDMQVFAEGADVHAPVTIAFGTTYALAQVLFPKVGQMLKSPASEGVEMRYYEQNTGQLHRHIESGALDIALMGDFGPNSEFDIRPLVRDPLVLVSPDGAPEPSGETVSIPDIADLPIVTYHTDHEPRTALDQAFKRAGVVPKVCAEAGSLTTILAHIQHGAGHGVIPLSSMIALGSEGRFRVRPIEGVFIQRNVVSRQVKATAEFNMVRKILIETALEFFAVDPRFRLSS